MLTIRGGTIINPKTGDCFTGDIDTQDGIIVRIEQTGEADFSLSASQKDAAQNRTGNARNRNIAVGLSEASTQDEIIDAHGLIVTAGLVDAHVHFREPGQTEKEDILTGAQAAAHGGFTSVIMMANTVPHPDTPEVLKAMLEKGGRTGIHVYAAAPVTRGMQGRELVDMKALRSAGAVLFTDDGLPIRDADLFRRACAEAAKLGVMISLHEEDPDFVYDAGVNEGKEAQALGLRGASREAEIRLVERDIKIAAEEGAEIMIQHISCAETVGLVRSARKKYDNIHAEATPHHFTLTEEAVARYGTLAKMNPPLRMEADRQAIIQGLADGTIEQIATDHAPHTRAEKERSFKQAPSGIIGLETALGLAIRELVRPGTLSLETLLKRMSTSPAVFAGLPAGTLAEGGPADVLIFDPREEFTAGDFFSKAENSPFIGERLPGLIRRVYAGGRLVYEHA